jgi:hypothetical protein
MSDHVGQRSSAWHRLTDLLAEITPALLEGAVLDESKLVRLHERASYGALQKHMIKFLEQTKMMSKRDIYLFCGIARGTYYEWRSGGRPADGPLLAAAIRRARREFGDTFRKSEPNDKDVHLAGLIDIIGQVRMTAFNQGNAHVRRGMSLTGEWVKIIAYLFATGVLEPYHPPREKEAAFFGILKSFQATSNFSNNEIIDYLYIWLKPFTAVYLRAPHLFDDGWIDHPALR